MMLPMSFKTALRRLSLSAALAVSVLTISSPEPVDAQEACRDLVTINFEEGAPVDRFVIKNTSENFSISAIRIDLSSSKGRLIFDTTSGGKGVEVFQPYRSVSGSAKIADTVSVKDGAEQVAIQFESFPAQSDYTFSIDVDDRLTASELGQIRISGNEMEGAVVSFELVGRKGVAQRVTASFDKDNLASVRNDSCSS